MRCKINENLTRKATHAHKLQKSKRTKNDHKKCWRQFFSFVVKIFPPSWKIANMCNEHCLARSRINLFFALPASECKLEISLLYKFASHQRQKCIKMQFVLWTYFSLSKKKHHKKFKKVLRGAEKSTTGKFSQKENLKQWKKSEGVSRF